MRYMGKYVYVAVISLPVVRVSNLYNALKSIHPVFIFLIEALGPISGKNLNNFF